jgi:hypothetical protein
VSRELLAVAASSGENRPHLITRQGRGRTAHCTHCSVQCTALHTALHLTGALCTALYHIAQRGEEVLSHNSRCAVTFAHIPSSSRTPPGVTGFFHCTLRKGGIIALHIDMEGFSPKNRKQINKILISLFFAQFHYPSGNGLRYMTVTFE